MSDLDALLEDLRVTAEHDVREYADAASARILSALAGFHQRRADAAMGALCRLEKALADALRAREDAVATAAEAHRAREDALRTAVGTAAEAHRAREDAVRTAADANRAREDALRTAAEAHRAREDAVRTAEDAQREREDAVRTAAAALEAALAELAAARRAAGSLRAVVCGLCDPPAGPVAPPSADFCVRLRELRRLAWTPRAAPGPLSVRPAGAAGAGVAAATRPRGPPRTFREWAVLAVGAPGAPGGAALWKALFPHLAAYEGRVGPVAGLPFPTDAAANGLTRSAALGHVIGVLDRGGEDARREAQALLLLSCVAMDGASGEEWCDVVDALPRALSGVHLGCALCEEAAAANSPEDVRELVSRCLDRAAERCVSPDGVYGAYCAGPADDGAPARPLPLVECGLGSRAAQQARNMTHKV